MRRFAVVVLALCSIAFAQTPAQQAPADAEHKHSAVAQNPVFERMKMLVGDWEGKMNEGGKEYPAQTSFKMVSDNSVLMNVLGAGTPYEMVTMFHPDGQDFLATHYCAAHNQPRMKAAAMTDPNTILFEFKDATNVGPNDGRMDHVKFTFIDKDHHIEEWSSLNKGVMTTGRFEFARKK